MFTEGLIVELILTIDGTAHTVPGSQVKNVSLDIWPYGYEGEVDFWISSDDVTDALYDTFVTSKIMVLGLKISSADQPEDSELVPLTLTGLVTEKRLFEEAYEKASSKVLYRRYGVRFGDPARVLWRQHYPCELHIDSDLKTVIDGHKTTAPTGGTIKLTYDMTALTVKHPIIFVPLGIPANEASFYDLVIWYLSSQNAVLTYSTLTSEYAITQEKDAAADVAALNISDVEGPEIVFPEVPRHDVKVWNALALENEAKDVKQDYAVAGVRRDHLIREPVKSAFDARTTLEEAMLFVPEHELHLVFRRFPTVNFRPGTYVEFAEETWSTDLFYKTKVYRVREASLQLAAVDQGHEVLGVESAEFDCDVTAVLELVTDKAVALPPFRAPRFPALVEGLVVSEEGAEDEETYQIYENTDTKLEEYKVKIPLWEDKVVVVRYNPNLLPAQFYFPHLKGAHVLVALEFQAAWIKRILDWRPNGRLPMDGQGNHILFGKGKEKKDQTSLQHYYEDDKPILTLQRTLENDTELIRLEEGILVLQTREEDS